MPRSFTPLFLVAALAGPALALDVADPPQMPPAADANTPDFSDLLSELDPTWSAQRLRPARLGNSPWDELAQFAVTPRTSWTVEPTPSADESAFLEQTWRVNINTAPPELLSQLPMIDPVRARAIVTHREANGPFADTFQITDVFGISSPIYLQLAPHLTVEGETVLPPPDDEGLAMEAMSTPANQTAALPQPALPPPR